MNVSTCLSHVIYLSRYIEIPDEVVEYLQQHSENDIVDESDDEIYDEAESEENEIVWKKWEITI